MNLITAELDYVKMSTDMLIKIARKVITEGGTVMCSPLFAFRMQALDPWTAYQLKSVTFLSSWDIISIDQEGNVIKYGELYDES